MDRQHNKEQGSGDAYHDGYDNIYDIPEHNESNVNFRESAAGRAAANENLFPKNITTKQPFR